MMEKNCSLLDVHHLMGKKWALFLLETLEKEGNLRFNVLQQVFPTITPRVLTQRLRECEEHALVQKLTVETEKTTYGLTEKGKELLELFKKLREWHEKHNKKSCTTEYCFECKAV